MLNLNLKLIFLALVIHVQISHSFGQRMSRFGHPIEFKNTPASANPAINSNTMILKQLRANNATPFSKQIMANTGVGQHSLRRSKLNRLAMLANSRYQDYGKDYPDFGKDYYYYYDYEKEPQKNMPFQDIKNSEVKTIEKPLINSQLVYPKETRMSNKQRGDDMNSNTNPNTAQGNRERNGKSRAQRRKSQKNEKKDEELELEPPKDQAVMSDRKKGYYDRDAQIQKMLKERDERHKKQQAEAKETKETSKKKKTKKKGDKKPAYMDYNGSTEKEKPEEADSEVHALKAMRMKKLKEQQIENMKLTRNPQMIQAYNLLSKTEPDMPYLKQVALLNYLTQYG